MFGGRGFFRGLGRGAAQTRKSDWQQPRIQVARKMELGSWPYLTALVIQNGGDSVIVYGSKAVADYIVANGKLPVEDGQFVEGIVSVTHCGWDDVSIDVMKKRIQKIHGQRFNVKYTVGVIVS